MELESKGAEIAIGNFHNYEHWQIALKDVQRVYFNYPIAKGMHKLNISLVKSSGFATLIDFENDGYNNTFNYRYRKN